jgi:hypothetical protein
LIGEPRRQSAATLDLFVEFDAFIAHWTPSNRETEQPSLVACFKDDLMEKLFAPNFRTVLPVRLRNSWRRALPRVPSADRDCKGTSTILPVKKPGKIRVMARSAKNRV